MAVRNGMTPAFSWALAVLVAGAAVAVAVVAILPRGTPAPAEKVVENTPVAVQPAEPAKAKVETPPEAPVAVEPAPTLAEPATEQAAVPSNSPPAPSSADDSDELLLKAAEPEPEPAPPAPVLPSFDTVRVDAQGAAVVAGQAGPGARVVLRAGDAILAETRADISGNFVALFDVPADGQGRLLALEAETPEGGLVAAAETVALAPVAAPTVDVAETTPPAALAITEDGARVLATAPPAGPVSIDTFSTDPSGKAQVAGRGAPGLTLRVYLDNAPQSELPIGDDGRWQLDLPALREGEHLIRVDQIAADGAVVSRAEQSVIREAPPVPAATEMAAAEPPPPVAEAPQAEPPVAETTPTEPSVAQATPVEPTPPVTPESTEQAVAAMVALGQETTPAEPQTQKAPLPAADSTAADSPATAPSPVTVTVQPGYSLWRIASEQLGDGVLYVQLFEANKDQIRNPDLIYPGQVFTLPSP